MSSLASIIAAGGVIKLGDPDGADVLALQMALTQAGYRVGTDSVFGPRTDQVVKAFQTQHGLKADGIVGAITAALLDAPHTVLVATAKPLTTPPTTGHNGGPVMWPHDDTASLLAFYGKPWENSALLANVSTVFPTTYGGQPVSTIRFHAKGAKALSSALEACWDKAGRDINSPVLRRIRNYSGAYNYRPIRGSSRLSCHAFGAAIDFDAEHLPLGKNVPSSEMPQEVVDAFKAQGFFWGGDYTGRKDPMHFQIAREG